MRLYINEAATTSRAVLAFVEAEGVAADIVSIDLMTGEHHTPSFCALNPNRLVPVLEDDGFVLTESSAILRYLARRSGSALYPSGLQAQARVDEWMAWFEANFYKDFGFGFVYPQVFPHHSRGSEAADAATVAFGLEQAIGRLAVLEQHLAATGPFLAGELSIADLHGASILSLGELVGFSLSDTPHVAEWYARVTERPAWAAINQAFAGMASAMQGSAEAVSA